MVSKNDDKNISNNDTLMVTNDDNSIAKYNDTFQLTCAKYTQGQSCLSRAVLMVGITA